MSLSRALVLDANIVIRAVLGPRVRQLLAQNHDNLLFFAPDVALADARRHLPTILTRRGIDPQLAMTHLEQVETLIQPVSADTYEPARNEALWRISSRDPDDWPILATALVLDCPIWTEDRDFFGSGVPTWTTDRVELYFRNTRPASDTAIR
ncbi:MAG: hypothetical protein LBN10_10205 [Propionibacteriaceae bacterium]|jgi:predicted nucleic acid-binding protein|nr:hypothetical protein [Propionibacteriaceae bacterium]